MRSTLLIGLLFLVNSCNRPNDSIIDPVIPPTTEFKRYRIPQAHHYSESTAFINIETQELKFAVKFDSSAIYTTLDPWNQYDINKLYGFSDNDANHHQFSARIGWRWSENKLRLFGYVYNNGVVIYNEIAAISIGKEHDCSIKVNLDSYVFTVGDEQISLPRLSILAKGKGYKLFPYFGGDETAPHDINIWIKEK